MPDGLLPDLKASDTEGETSLSDPQKVYGETLFWHNLTMRPLIRSWGKGENFKTLES